MITDGQVDGEERCFTRLVHHSAVGPAVCNLMPILFLSVHIRAIRGFRPPFSGWWSWVL